MKKTYMQPTVAVYPVQSRRLMAVSIFPDEYADPNLPVNVKGYGMMDGNGSLKATHNLWDDEW